MMLVLSWLSDCIYLTVITTKSMHEVDLREAIPYFYIYKLIILKMIILWSPIHSPHPIHTFRSHMPCILSRVIKALLSSVLANTGLIDRSRDAVNISV